MTAPRKNNDERPHPSVARLRQQLEESERQREALAVDKAQLLRRVKELEPYEPRTTGLRSGPEGMQMNVLIHQNLMRAMVVALDALNGAANYTETELFYDGPETPDPADPPRTYVVTVRRKDKPTPHELRRKAEAALEAFLTDALEVAAHSHCTAAELAEVDPSGSDRFVMQRLRSEDPRTYRLCHAAFAVLRPELSFDDPAD